MPGLCSVMGTIRTLGIADVWVKEISGGPEQTMYHDNTCTGLECLALTTTIQQRLIALGFARPFNFALALYTDDNVSSFLR